MKKNCVFFIVILSFCIVCHGSYEYQHSSGLVFSVPSGWTIDTSSDLSLTNTDGDIISIIISDLNADQAYYSENDFKTILKDLSVDTAPISVYFSKLPFFYATEEIETKMSLQDIYRELSYEEYVALFGDSVTSVFEYTKLKTEFLGLPGTQNNPYYYFYSAKAYASPEVTFDGHSYFFYYSGDIESLSDFESLLNSLVFPVKKPAVNTYLSSPDDYSYTPDASYDTISNQDPVSTSKSTSLFEKFVVGAIAASVFLFAPRLWSYGKKSKIQSITDGKIYYGVLYYRFILLCLAGFMSAEMILIPIVGDSLEDTQSIVLALLFSVPITVLYVRLYKKLFVKKHLSQIKSDSEEN